MTIPIQEVRTMRAKAKKEGKKLYVNLGGQNAVVLALSDCAPRYGSPGFRCVNGNGWYPLNGADFTFSVR